jgi:hypothetical protein
MNTLKPNSAQLHLQAAFKKRSSYIRRRREKRQNNKAKETSVFDLKPMYIAGKVL